jgi:hypothetical protein
MGSGQTLGGAALFPEKEDSKWTTLTVYIPTVWFDATSLVVYSYGYDDGRIGPTHCALIGGALGDR